MNGTTAGRPSRLAALPVANLLQALHWALALIGGVYAIVYLYVAISRIGYPFELEWMEGGMIEHIDRIRRGLPLYGEPSLDFVPYIYPALYYYVAAAVSLVTGPGFLGPRLVSLAASLVCAGLIFVFVRRESRQAYWGFISATFFLALYEAAGSWFDLARIDSLYLAFLLGAIAITRFDESYRGAVLAGTLIALAGLTKQTAAGFAGAIGLYLLLVDRRRLAYFVAAFVVVFGGITALLQLTTGGWYLTYTYYQPRHMHVSPEMFNYFWTRDIGLTLPGLAPAAGALLLALWQSRRHRRFLFYGLTLSGTLGLSLLGRIHTGGFENVLFPIYAIAAIIFGVLPSALARWPRTRRWLRHDAALAALLLAYLVQFGLLYYNPFPLIPTERDRRANQALVDRLAAIEGPVFVPSHSYLAVLAGKPGHAHGPAMEDVLVGGPDEAKAALTADLTAAIAERRFAAIVFDSYTSPNAKLWSRDIEDHYARSDAALEGDSLGWPPTGWRTRPATIWTPKPVEAGG